MFKNIDEIRKYVNVSGKLDFKLLEPYIEEAVRVRILPYIPEAVIEKIKDEPYFELLKKAAANYSVAYSIPFLKVHLSNTGGNNFTDSKTQKASWWDLRDFGLSAVGVADRALSAVIYELYSSAYKSELSIFQEGIFEGLWEFEKYYNLMNSWEVFTRIKPTIQRVWDLKVSTRVSVCSVDDLRVNPEVFQLLQSAVALFAVAEVTQLGGVSFTGEAMLIQWEELPWQQSKLLGPTELSKLNKSLTIQANNYLNKAIERIILEKEKNPNSFTCFTPKVNEREVIAKKSGLYL